MIVDTSAIMAMLLGEPEAQQMLRAMASAPSRLMSTGSWIELGTVIVRRQNSVLSALAEEMAPRLGLELVPVSIAHSRWARDAYARYGRGSGHPARLNFGDCFSYALAKETGEPMLFKGDNFTHTDIARAI